MEEKKIDINNDRHILKVFDFDYCYNLEHCSREMCLFYNDILVQEHYYNKQQAFIDLGRIAITLNQLNKENQLLKQLVKVLILKL